MLAEEDVVGDAGFAVGNGERDFDGAGELRRDIDVNLSSTYTRKRNQGKWTMTFMHSKRRDVRRRRRRI